MSRPGPAPRERAGARRAASQTLAGAALLITAVTIVSRLLGFARQVVQVHQVGTEGVGGAYAAANALPNILYEVAAGGALAGVVVPLLAGPVARRLRLDVDRSASALLSWAVAVLVPLGVLLLVLAPPIVSGVLGIHDDATADVATYFVRVFAVQVPLYGVGVVLSGVLQAHRRFFWPAAAPILSSLVVVVAYLAFGRLTADPADVAGTSDAALAWLAWGTTAGVAAMCLPLLIPVRRAGVRLRPTFSFPAGQAARARRLALAGVGAVVGQQVATLAALWSTQHWGGNGTWTVYQLAQAVYLLPYAVLAVPLATSAFPRIAERASSGDHAGFARLVGGTTRAVLAVSVVGAAALVALAPAVEAVFVRIAKGSVAGMAGTVAWLAPGLVGYALIFQLSRVLYTLDEGRAAVRATVLGWGTAAVASLVLPPLLVRHAADPAATLEGVAAASSLGMAVAGLLLLRAVRRSAPAGALRGTGRTVLVLGCGAVVGAGLGLLVVDALLPAHPGWPVALAVGALGALLAAAVVGAAVLVGDRGTVSGLGGLRRSSARGASDEPDDSAAQGGEVR
ncbi:murein biosynthesis integral membrane protein MurJ [Luteimicrobium subarcticum]|uniref:Putative peptidoglycan lipid II flippase n=1 Tax=Luteimicrobium subarcticum TaxID=620910 RepID=A0A2M8WWI9_9MICO|nr:lipid II flippase MurJ [Luteimicrobium subarcticum]PJI95287.1 putative peptidoglycan lipid II flippase [Luteimicrobium subarcticum]